MASHRSIPRFQQLPLPFPELPPPPHPPPEAPVLPPAQLWATLAPPLQARFRQTLLHLLQEVLHDAPHQSG
jgi:hypothetical protein